MAHSPIARAMGLKRPCKHCPFRVDVSRYLKAERYREIAAALLDEGLSFACHETLDRDDEGETRIAAESRLCAGAMIWLRHQNRPNAVMQVMERMGAFDPMQLDMTSPVYTTRDAFETGFDEHHLS